MDEIEVTARFYSDGNIRPITFVWETRTYKVTSIGRHWEAPDGHHILVMDPREQVYHLIFKPETTQWYLFHGGKPNLSRA